PPDESDVHLSERGQARSRALAALLTTNLVLVPNRSPAALFAPRFTRRGHTLRPSETLEPLAHQLKLPVQTTYSSTGYAALAKHILADPALDGKTVVVCWIHDYLPDLAKAFGVKPKPTRWRGSIYDRVWVINYQGDQAFMKDLPQKLLPGDSTE
ncbi:MAG: hypothetical protein ACREP9_17025, partial [Candidatus Dormibacteraceae bacterium]